MSTFIKVIKAGPSVVVLCKGGSGSGNFGHEGRPGEVGGSGEGGDSGRSLAKVKLGHAETLYHVTTRDNLEGIKKEGLKRSSISAQFSHMSGTEEYETDGVFLANAGQAKVLMSQFKDNGQDPVLLEVYLKKGTELVSDPLMPESSVVVPGDISARVIREVASGVKLYNENTNLSTWFEGDKDI
jgi:hypothetical protein